MSPHEVKLNDAIEQFKQDQRLYLSADPMTTIADQAPELSITLTAGGREGVLKIVDLVRNHLADCKTLSVTVSN